MKTLHGKLKSTAPVVVNKDGSCGFTVRHKCGHLSMMKLSNVPDADREIKLRAYYAAGVCEACGMDLDTKALEAEKNAMDAAYENALKDLEL